MDIGGGLVCPKENAKQMMRTFRNFQKMSVNENSKSEAERRQSFYHLRNYECGYSGDLTQAIETLEGYGIGEEEVREVYRKHKNSL